MRKQKRIRTTTNQRAAIDLLKKRIAELGYSVFCVNKKYRKHYLDFVGVLRSNSIGTPNLFLVHPLRNDSVLVRPYWRNQPHKAHEAAIRALRQHRIFYRKQGLRRPEGGNSAWEEYLTPGARNEYMLLTS